MATDLNKDGVVDVVTTTSRGTFIFWGKARAAGAKTATTSSSRD
jgi:hypothetical protein